MLKKVAILSALVGLAVSLEACAPGAVPPPTPISKAPTVAPAAAAKTAEPTKPAATATATPKPATLRFGSIPTTGLAGVYLAVEKGYFKEQGIILELVDFRTTPEIIAPLGTGLLDVAGLALSTPLLAAADRGVELKLVAAAGTTTASFEYNWIMLRKDLKDSGQVKSAADLKGMKVSVPSQGSIGDQTVQMMLEQAGLKPEETEIIVLPAAEQAAAFANKAVAAGYTVEPQVTRSVQDGVAVKWMPVSPFYGGQAHGSAIVFGPSILKDQDLSRRWMLAYVKAVRDYLKGVTARQGWEEMVKSLIKYTPVKEAGTYEAMEMPYIDPNVRLDKNSINIQYRWSVDKGFYTGKKSFDDITDLSYTDYAVQRLGRQ